MAITNKRLSARTTWILCALSLLVPIVFPIMLVAAIKAQIDENKEKENDR